MAGLWFVFASFFFFASVGCINVNVVQSIFDAHRPIFLQQGSFDFVAEKRPNAETTQAFVINPAVKHQTIEGFGGAFTDAASRNWKAMSPADQEDVIHSYFGDPQVGGNGYTMGRVPMGSTDFSVYSYNFNNHSGDTSMRHFDDNVTHDQAAMLPMIHAAQARVEARGLKLKIFSSPWSPPAWMKLPVDGQRSMSLSADPNGLDPRYQDAWAKYTSRFVSAYQRFGVKLWGVTVQNEPEASPGWESCKMQPSYMASFVRNHLGPTLRRDHPDLKIMGFDHNKDHVYRYTKVLYSDPVTRSYLDGIGVHWYGGLGRQGLNMTHFLDTTKFILGTEACNCGGVVTRNDPVQWWSRAEALGLDTLEDLKYWAVGWLHWNLVLDTQGGPNHHGNFCDGNIISDPENTLGLGTLIKQASYYYMAHFSRFIPPGSRRVDVENAVKSTKHPLTPKDILNGKSLLFEKCDSNAAPQRWYYHPEVQSVTVWGTKEAAGSDGFEHGMCMDVVDGLCHDGQRLQVWSCDTPNPNVNQVWTLRAVTDGYQIYSPHCDKCVVANTVAGDAVGLDPGVQIVGAELGPCTLGGSPAQTFEFSNYPDIMYMPTSVSLVDKSANSEHRCLQPLAKRQPKFDAVAFEKPNGDITLVALNLADSGIEFHMHDAVSSAGRVQWLHPRSIVTYTWTPVREAALAAEPASHILSGASKIDAFCSSVTLFSLLLAGVGVFLLALLHRSPHALSLHQRLIQAGNSE